MNTYISPGLSRTEAPSRCGKCNCKMLRQFYKGLRIFKAQIKKLMSSLSSIHFCVVCNSHITHCCSCLFLWGTQPFQTHSVSKLLHVIACLHLCFLCVCGGSDAIQMQVYIHMNLLLHKISLTFAAVKQKQCRSYKRVVHYMKLYWSWTFLFCFVFYTNLSWYYQYKSR